MFIILIVSRSTGWSAVSAAAYRAGEKLRCDRDDLTHDNSIGAAAYRSGEKLGEYDYTRKKGVVHTEIMLPENAPKKFQDRATLWNAVDKSEKRKDAQMARDIDVALPVEFNHREQIDTVREYVRENFVDKGMIADFAIHDNSDGYAPESQHAQENPNIGRVDEQGDNWVCGMPSEEADKLVSAIFSRISLL